MEGAYEYLNAEVPEIIAIPDDDEWADIKNIKDLTGAIDCIPAKGSTLVAPGSLSLVLHIILILITQQPPGL